MGEDSASPLPRHGGADHTHAVRDGLLARLARLFRGRESDPLREQIEELIEERFEERNGNGEVAIDPHEQALIANVLGLRGLTAADIMVPRADIVAVEVDTPIDALAAQMSEAGHSRLPAYRKTLDDVVGFAHIKDVVRWIGKPEAPPLQRLLRPVLFVSPAMRALDLLQQMRVTRQHLALVVDEYGGTDGIITIEDLVEQIVGEIADEHDVDDGPQLVANPDGTITAAARATLEEFEAMVGPVFSEDEREETDTLGGIVFALAGRIAGRGEIVRHPSGVEFEVLEADPRRLKRLRVRLPAGVAPLQHAG